MADGQVGSQAERQGPWASCSFYIILFSSHGEESYEESHPDGKAGRGVFSLKLFTALEKELSFANLSKEFFESKCSYFTPAYLSVFLDISDPTITYPTTYHMLTL